MVVTCQLAAAARLEECEVLIREIRMARLWDAAFDFRSAVFQLLPGDKIKLYDFLGIVRSRNPSPLF